MQVLKKIPKTVLFPPLFSIHALLRLFQMPGSGELVEAKKGNTLVNIFKVISYIYCAMHKVVLSQVLKLCNNFEDFINSNTICK